MEELVEDDVELEDEEDEEDVEKTLLVKAGSGVEEELLDVVEVGLLVELGELVEPEEELRIELLGDIDKELLEELEIATLVDIVELLVVELVTALLNVDTSLLLELDVKLEEVPLAELWLLVEMELLVEPKEEPLKKLVLDAELVLELVLITLVELGDEDAELLEILELGAVDGLDAETVFEAEVIVELEVNAEDDDKLVITLAVELVYVLEVDCDVCTLDVVEDNEVVEREVEALETEEVAATHDTS